MMLMVHHLKAKVKNNLVLFLPFLLLLLHLLVFFLSKILFV